MKFKRGDRVVLVSSPVSRYNHLVGTVLIIGEHLPTYFDEDGEWYNVGKYNFPDSVLEHEAVYGSPLYKALL